MKPATLARRLGRLSAFLALPCLQVFAAAKPAGETAAARWSLEDNRWPLVVQRDSADGKSHASQAFGPFFHESRDAAGNFCEGFRPFYLHREWPASKSSETAWLYPIFVYKSNADRWHWSLLGLINRSSPSPSQADKDRGFDIWPIYFSRNTGNPATSYKAVFPLWGTLISRLYNDRIDWVLFPAYSRFQSGEKVVKNVPWPFVRLISGGPHRGWAVWPLGGWREVKGKSESWYALWPFLYESRQYGADTDGRHAYGFFPFYTGVDSATSRSRTYLWPFFGWSERSGEEAYREQRYLWPLFLQGRGTSYRNRWAPFYTHSVARGVDKTWVLWPFWMQRSWSEHRLDVKRSQFLFFLYWNQTERRAGAREGAPEASKTHVWPLVSTWNNGAGRRQVQLLSPLEPIFRHNEEMRLNWTPFFALYRQDSDVSGELHRSALWNLVSYDRSRTLDRSRFNLGPLFTHAREGAGRRVSFLRGLFGIKKSDTTGRWSPFFADFNSSSPSAPVASDAPSKP